MSCLFERPIDLTLLPSSTRNPRALALRTRYTISYDSPFAIRSPKPQRYFMANVLPNIEKGNAVWKGWFGDAAPGVGENGSPMDTACFCDVSTCTDG